MIGLSRVHVSLDHFLGQIATRSVDNLRTWNELRLMPEVIKVVSLSLRGHLHLWNIIVVSAWHHWSAPWARRNRQLIMVHHLIHLMLLLLIGVKLH